MNGYVLSASVEFDLDEIWEYIAADNIDAADRRIGKLFDSFEDLWMKSPPALRIARPSFQTRMWHIRIVHT